MDDIEVVAGPQRHVFSAPSVVVLGRGDTATLRLDNPLVGRVHAQLVPAEDGWALVDESSRNGTWLDGSRVTRVAIRGPVTFNLGGPSSSAVVSIRPVSAAALDRLPDAGAPAAPAAPTPPAVALAPPGSPAGALPLPAPTPPMTPPPPAPAPAVATAAPAAPPRPAGPSGHDVLVVRFGGEQHLFPMGQPVRVGRDPSLELVTENPLVSRQQHGVITSDPHGAYYTDTSSRGTFFEGRPVKGQLAITESVVLLLGDAATGEPLGITPPLGAAEIVANTQRRQRRRRLRRAALVGVAALVVAGGAGAGVALSGGGGTATSTTTASFSAVLAHAESATVRLLQGPVDNFAGWGSGTIISPTGLILTNGHVAEPQAAGEAVAAGSPQSQLDQNPPYLTVELTKGQSTPAVPTYRAKPVAVDGYLDLAVVQIYATDTGQPVDPSTLHLPYLPLGNVAGVQLDEPVTVIGYPGVTDSDSITVTSGVVSTFVPDPLGHVKDPRFELETTARVAHGNSGGAAIDSAGHLIGVPSLTLQGEGTDISWRLRSVAEALPLVRAAKAGTPYSSPWLVASSPGETVQAIGFGADQNAACGSSTSVPSGTTTAYIGVQYSGFPNGIDAALEIAPPNGNLLTNQNGQLPEFVLTGGSGCETYQIGAQDFGQSTLQGSIDVQLLAGPELQPVGSAATLSAGG